MRADRHARPAEGAAVTVDVLVELCTEVLKGRDDRAGGAVAEGTEGTAEDRVTDVRQRVHVLAAALAALQPGEDLPHPVGALAAGRALAARLVRVEPGEVQAGADDADVLREHDERAGAEQAAGALDALEVHGRVQVVGGEQRGGGPARRPRLELLAVEHAARRAGDELPGRRAERVLVVARPPHVAAHAEQLRPRRLLRPHGAEPVHPLAEDPGHARDRLYVVDRGRCPVQALERGKRRPQLWLATLALQRGQQRGLLAADVGARAAMQHHLEVEAGALDVTAEQATLIGLPDRGGQAPAGEAALAAQVDERLLAADRVGRNDRALDQRVRVAPDQLRRRVANARQPPVQAGGGQLGRCAVAGQRRRRQLVAQQPLHQRQRLMLAQPLVVLGVDLEHRGTVAGGQALDLLDGDRAAWVGPAGRHAEPPAQRLGDLAGPAELA